MADGVPVEVDLPGELGVALERASAHLWENLLLRDRRGVAAPAVSAAAGMCEWWGSARRRVG